MTMIIFSSRKLEKAIAEDELSNWKKAKYVILPAVLAILAGGPIYFITPTYGEKAPALNFFLHMVFNILGAYVTYYGIKKCFRTNEIIDGNNFLERFVILLIPVAVKLIIILLPFALIYYGIASSFRDSHPIFFKRSPIILYALRPIFIYIYYSLLNHSFIRLKGLISQRDI
ncbi:MAG: hypothetical protein PHN82_02540 [bacterium]|nr:hypothetical protein [bacterium]